MADFEDRYPRRIMQAYGPSNKGPLMDSAWSNPDNEFPLANALREKAKTMDVRNHPDNSHDFKQVHEND